jgi:hypothetical protein
MKYLLCIFLCCCVLSSHAGFAYIVDKDGYVLVRDAPSIKGKVIDTLKAGDLVYCFEEAEHWTNIDYAGKVELATGYIYKDRYKKVADFVRLPVVSTRQHEVKLRKDTLEVVITTKPFVKAQHKINYSKEHPDMVKQIDGEPFWGTDGQVPKVAYSAITISMGNKKSSLPKSFFKNLFEPNLDLTIGNFDAATNTVFLQATNSDGAGGYMVLWKIVDGKYKQRLVVYGF